MLFMRFIAILNAFNTMLNALNVNSSERNWVISRKNGKPTMKRTIMVQTEKMTHLS